MCTRKKLIYWAVFFLILVFFIKDTILVSSAHYSLSIEPVIVDSLKARDTVYNINIFNRFKGYLGSIFTLYTFFIAILIFMENKDPSKTVAWLLILFLVPVIGFIFYLFLGQNVRKKTIFKRKKGRDFVYFDHIASIQKDAIKDKALFEDDESFVKRRLISLILNSAKAPFTINNKSTVLTNGTETYDAIMESLNSAENHIHLEYFIIKNDHIGNKVKKVLIEKARQGVKVRVIYDSVGSWRIGKDYIRDMEEVGIEVHAFLPVYFPVLSRELNYRNHRKIIVVDGKIGFLGGLNIGDEYLGKNTYLGFWRDTHLKIEGEAVYGLQNIFLMDWLFVTKERIEFNSSYFPKLDYYGEQLIQITGSGPDSDWESIMQAYFSIIASAEDRIWINTPYLVPDESIFMALKTAALSGVDVKIIIPNKPDHKTVFWASMANVEELLRAGVKIYKYTKGFTHAKLLMVDGIAASIGTANLDIRSFLLNFEVNAFIYDKEIVNRLEDDFLIDINDSNEIVLEEHIKRPLTEKIKESTGRLFSPLL